MFSDGYGYIRGLTGVAVTSQRARANMLSCVHASAVFVRKFYIYRCVTNIRANRAISPPGVSVLSQGTIRIIRVISKGY